MTQDDPKAPRGIEALLALAAVDPTFAAALERDRAAAIEASGVALTPAEREVLRVTEEPALRQMAASIAGLLSEQDRRAFLGRSAAATAALLAVSTATGCKDKNREEIPAPTGCLSDHPPPRPRPPAPPPRPTPDARPQPPAPTGIRPDRPGPTRGIRPDRPGPTGEKP